MLPDSYRQCKKSSEKDLLQFDITGKPPLFSDTLRFALLPIPCDTKVGILL
jgi:hypothetical protein